MLIHRNRFFLTHFAARRFQETLTPLQREVFYIKLKGIQKDPDFYKQIKPLKNLEPATHFVNLGADRLILKALKNHCYLVLDIENRRERV